MSFVHIIATVAVQIHLWKKVLLEEEMWKRAAVTAAKLRMHEPPNDYRHRATKEMRIAFQNGRVSSPITRHSLKTVLYGATTNVVVLTASGVTFLSSADVIIGSTTILLATVTSATNSGTTTILVLLLCHSHSVEL